MTKAEIKAREMAKQLGVKIDRVLIWLDDYTVWLDAPEGSYLENGLHTAVAKGWTEAQMWHDAINLMYLKPCSSGGCESSDHE